MEADRNGENEKIDDRYIDNSINVKFSWLRHIGKQLTAQAYR